MTTTTTHRNTIVTGAALVAAVAMAASADTLAGLGRAVGWADLLAWSLPVSVDVLALVAGLAWLSGGAGESLGRALTLMTVAASVVLNSVGHLVSTGHVKAGGGLVIAVSAVPPLAAALAVHLGATATSGEPADTADTATDTADTSADTDRVEAFVEDRQETPQPEPRDTAAPDVDSDTDTADTVPVPGVQLVDTELDAVVHLIVAETNPPRSYREMEARFRELGYIAGAVRLRDAYKRVTATATA